MNQRTDNELTAHRRFEGRLTLLWTILTYLIAVGSLWAAYVSQPELVGGWRLAVLAVLLTAYFVLYHRVLLPGPEVPTLRWTAAYGVPQSLVVATLLVLFGPAFLGLAIAFAMQFMAVLPVRFWIIPVFGLAGIMLIAFDLVEELRQGDLELMVMLTVQAAAWASSFGVLLLLLRQRRRLAELVEELRRAQAELRRAAAQADELAILRERTRLAREMHDSLGHALVTINVKLEVVERLYARDVERGVTELRATRELVRRAMVDLRQSLDDLRGPIPASRDLPVDLHRLLAEFQERTSIVATSDVGPEALDLPLAIRETIWTMLPEALQNVERHAGAGSVAVTLSRQGESVVLRVADDGAGIAASDFSRAGRHGLTGMRERVEAAGGAFRIVSRPGGGTVIEAAFPPTPPAPADDKTEQAATRPALVSERI